MSTERIPNNARVEWAGRTCLVFSLGADSLFPECGPEYRLESDDEWAVRYLAPKDELEAVNPNAPRVQA